MMKRTPLVALVILYFWGTAAFLPSASQAGSPAARAIGSLLGAVFWSAIAFRLAYGRWPLPGLFSRPFWFGQPLAHKYAILVGVAVLFQLAIPLDPVTRADIWLAPFTAAIWLAAGYAIWRVGQAGHARIGRSGPVD